MNKALLILAIVATCAAKAQQPYQLTPKDWEKHEKAVAKSKEKGDALWDYDTVFNAGVPYCIVYKVDKGALVHDDYSVRSLTGQELIYVKYGTYTDYSAPHQPNTAPPTYGYYTYLFLDTKQTAETQTLKVYKEVVKNGLIKNGSMVDPDAETKFISFNGPKYSQMTGQPTVYTQPVQYAMVNRDRNGAISINGNQILQAGMVIGNLQYGDSYVNGVHLRTITVFFQNMQKVSYATDQDGQMHFWNINTTRDNRNSTVTSSDGNDAMDLVKYLIYGNYL